MCLCPSGRPTLQGILLVFALVTAVQATTIKASQGEGTTDVIGTGLKPGDVVEIFIPGNPDVKIGAGTADSSGNFTESFGRLTSLGASPVGSNLRGILFGTGDVFDFTIVRDPKASPWDKFVDFLTTGVPDLLYQLDC